MIRAAGPGRPPAKDDAMQPTRRNLALGAAASLGLGGRRAWAAPDRVRVGVFPVSAALPFWVAQQRGFFAAQNIEVVPTTMASSTVILGSFLTGDLDAGAAVVTIESLNVNLRAPGTVVYISLNGQNAAHRQETFMVRKGLDVTSIAGLKGKARNFMAASGPANMSMARAVLAANGLEERRDYTLTDLAVSMHVGALRAGTFDAGYVLEPAGTILQRSGDAVELERGVIATYVLGRRDALAFAAGGTLTAKFVAERPDVARRYAIAFRQAIAAINADPTTREALKVNTSIPPELVTEVGIPLFKMVGDLTPTDRADFQAFIDASTAQGVLRERIETGAALVTLDR
jgi:NitT/TauT family transport system substrate-binding protein